ncbi:MAG: DUF3597 domain-containing protein [Treponema sp.]|nr:DUF3597 domain-containing protein [Treponema sp.]
MSKLSDLASSLFSKTSISGGTKSSTVKALTDSELETVLANLASQKGGGGNYKVSIVDLLKLLGLDSSLAARKVLAEKLNVNAGEHGSAEQNTALHKAVLQALAANGGEVPANLK